MSAMPTDALELRAAEERQRLHSSVVELKSQVREKLDVQQTARDYLPVASCVAALFGLAMGYSFTGVFTRH